jgi:hypothetical protein
MTTACHVCGKHPAAPHTTATRAAHASHLAATGHSLMCAAPRPLIRRQVTGWYVTTADGSPYTDVTGHGWFSKTLARQLARETGGWYEQGNRTTVKEVVTGYETPAQCDRPHVYTLVVLGGRHRYIGTPADTIHILAELSNGNGEGYVIARHADRSSCAREASRIENEAIASAADATRCAVCMLRAATARITADSPAMLDGESEQLAREERWS